MNIYKKIDKIFSDNTITIEQRPSWADEILNEVKELRKEVAQLQQHQVNTRSSQVDGNKMQYINNLREEMKPDVQNNIFPYVLYKNIRFGINFKGYLYNIDNHTTITKQQAFEIYDYLYKYQIKPIIKHNTVA